MSTCRIANLERAQRAKVVQAAIKRGLADQADVESAREATARLLEAEPREFLGTMRALDLLAAGRGLGRQRALRHLIVAGIPERCQVRDFTPRQREALISSLRAATTLGGRSKSPGTNPTDGRGLGAAIASSPGPRGPGRQPVGANT